MVAVASVCARWSWARAAGWSIVDNAELRKLYDKARPWLMSVWLRGNGYNYGRRIFRDHRPIDVQMAVQGAESELIIQIKVSNKYF